MTIEELADLSADELCKLSNEELTKILSPYFAVTRPEMIVRTEKKQEAPVYISPQKQAALALLAEEGVDISFLNRKKKK